MKTKRFVFAAALAMLCIFLAACTTPAAPTATPGPGGPTFDPTIVDYEFPGLPEAGTYDFGGRTFKVYSYHGQPFEQREDFMRRYAQNIEIQNRYNCKIEYDMDLERGKNDALVGAPTIDTAYLMNHQIAQWVIGGIAEPLNNVMDELHADDARWDETVTEWATINGNTYAMGKVKEELWKYHYVLTMFMNKDLLTARNINVDEIYTLQENKQWTWDKFAEYAGKVTADMNQDDIPDVYGTVYSGMLPAFTTANQTAMFHKTDAGFTFGYDDAVIETLTFMADLYRNGAARGTQMMTGIPASQDGSDFMDGKIGFYISAFSTTWISFQSSNGGMTDDYGVLCIPMAPGEEEYYFADNMYAAMAIFAQKDDARTEEIAKFLYLYNTSLYASSEDEEECYWTEARNRIGDIRDEYALRRIFEKDSVKLIADTQFAHTGVTFSYETIIEGTQDPLQSLQEQTPVLKELTENVFNAAG